ncbi:MAG: S8 family peptidase [Colwellia sp.]|nr:S8 family peptidase [Colwellia sp.]
MANVEKKSVIVTFKSKEQRPDKSKDKLDVVNATITSKVNFFNADDMSRGVTVPSGMPLEMIGYDVNQYEAPIVMATLTEKEIDGLRKNGNIAAVEDDGPCYAVDSFQGPEKLIVEGQPSVQAETVPAGIAQVKAPAAWDCSRGKAIKVAVLDTGIDYDHPDLKANYKFGVSFVPSESNAKDYNSHGTHCAGTIAAAINGAGVVGVAPAAYLYAVKVLSKTGGGSWSWLISGIDWCVNKKGLNILSMSMGGSSAPSALETMCNAAWNKGALLIAAAGNNGGAVIAPARYKNVVAVSAIDSANLIAGFSSRGPEVELSAPGVSVLSTIPGGGYGTKSGTSMACPHVSGAAALTWGAHRYANNITIRRLLAWTSDNLGAPGRDDLYGYGRVDAEQAACALTEPPAIPGIP